MKYRLVHIFLMLFAVWGVKAQTADVFNDIRQATDMDGNPLVVIHQDPQITRLINDKIKGVNRRTSETQGYRVQVFSSSVPRTAKSAAFKTEKKFNDEMPQLNSYVVFQPPFWKVRLGDFLSSEEAREVCDEIRNKFPDIQGDVYIVRDNIQIVE